MKVLHFAPTLQVGSSTQLAADLAYALQIFDVQSILLSPNRESVSSILSSKVRHISYSPSSLLGAWGRVMKLRQTIATHKPDIIHAYGYAAVTLATRACRYLAPGSRPPIVAALLGFPEEADFMQSTGIASCASITIISKHLRQALKKSNPTLIKSWLIPYGVNETLCYPGYKPAQDWADNWLRNHPEMANRYRICLPAPISPDHGTSDIVPLLTSLFQQEVPAHALIVGDVHKATPAYLRSLHRSISAAGLEPYITWLEPPPNLRDVMSLCHAVVNLSQTPAAYERPTLEALALGRPVVGYGHGVVGEYLETFQPMAALPVGDVEAIADILTQWYFTAPDPISHIPFPYNLSDTAKSYHDLYTSLL